MNHEYYMAELIKLSSNMDAAEVPISAMIVKDNKILSTGLNTREKFQSVLAHAEIQAIENASKILNDWNLSGATLYVTLEPCPMCAGAILQSHISRVVFGAYETKSGALGSRYNISNKNLEIIGGVLEEQCQNILNSFFEKLRKH